MSPKSLPTSIYSVVINSAPLLVVARRVASSANWHSAPLLVVARRAASSANWHSAPLLVVARRAASSANWHSAPLLVVARRVASSANWHSFTFTSAAFLVYHLNNFLSSLYLRYMPASSKLLALAFHHSMTKHEYRLKSTRAMEQP